MSARILDGRATAARQRERIGREVADLAAREIVPGLAAILVGDDPASQVYVGAKERACEAVGMVSHGVRLSTWTSQEELHAEIARLNADPAVHGIIVQLPLPGHLDPVAAQEVIAPEKDVDALHPVNEGRLIRGDPYFLPATPLGIQVLLADHDVAVAGTHVVIVGRSLLVGRPLSLLLSRKGGAVPSAAVDPRMAGDATVTICHTGTVDLAEHTRRAHILVVAAGRPGTVTAEMVTPGAVVVDVGTNRGADGKLVGDVDFAGVSQVAGAISPVPGGVGPMTVTMLLHNTLLAARLLH